MKYRDYKYLIALSFLVVCNVATADVPSSTSQQPDTADTQTRSYYIEIECTQNLTPNSQPTVRIVMGTVLRNLLQLTDEEYRRIAARRFPSLIDAANVFGTAGWSLVSTDSYEQRGARVTRWVMSRTAAHPNELLTGLL